MSMMATAECEETDLDTEKHVFRSKYCNHSTNNRKEKSSELDEVSEASKLQSDNELVLLNCPTIDAEEAAKPTAEETTSVFAKPSVPLLRSRQLKNARLLKKKIDEEFIFNAEKPLSTRCQKNGSGLSPRTRRSINSSDLLGTSNNLNHSQFSNSKSSSNNCTNNSLSNIYNNKQKITLTASYNKISSKDSLTQQNHNCIHDFRQSANSLNSGPCHTRSMGVLCTEKPCSNDKCCCEDAMAKSPKPAALPSFSCHSPNSHINYAAITKSKDDVLSRKRSLDAASLGQEDTTVPISKRRTHRSPSAGVLNGSKCLTLDITALSQQNGHCGVIKHEVMNGFKIPEGFLNGSRPICCIGMDMKSDSNNCMDQDSHHHNNTYPQNHTANSFSLLSPSLTPSPSSSSSSPSPSSPVSSPPVLCQCNCNVGNNVATNSNAVSNGSDTEHRSAKPLCDGLNPVCLEHAENSIQKEKKQSQTKDSLPLLVLSHSQSGSSHSCNSQEKQVQSSPRGSSNLCANTSTNTRTRNFSDNSNSSDQSDKSIPLSSCSNLRQRAFSGSSGNFQKSLSSIKFKDSVISSDVSSSLCSTQLLVSTSKSKTIHHSSLASSSSSNSSGSSSPSTMNMVTASLLQTEPSSPAQTPSKLVECKWRGCGMDNLEANSLLDHINQHVETQITKENYACLWLGCKVYNKPSWSGSWLERHVVAHSGHRPFKCILDKCSQRFHSKAALERHVNIHFAAQSQQSSRNNRSKEEIASRLLQKRKRQLIKRRSMQAVKRNDVFDTETMSVVKHDLLSLTKKAQMDLSSGSLNATFHSQVIGRRVAKSGDNESLIEFSPENILEDRWLPNAEAACLSKVSIPVAHLPNDSVTNLHSSLYRRHRFRKHRRK